MKKWLSLFPVSLIAITLQAQPMPAAQTTAQAAGNASAQAAAETGHASASAVQATELNARLTKQIDTKHAKVGDEVLARTTSTARLANGMKLPSGTKLLGKVTEVQAKSHAHRTSRLAFTFDRAVLRHGETIPIHAVLMSVSVPSAMAEANGMGDMGAGPVAGGGMAGGGAMAGPGPAGGGGLVGGAAHTVGGVAGGAGSFVGGTMRTATNTTGNLNGDLGSGAGALTGGANGALGVSHGSVAGLPGVMFSSTANGSDSAAMTAKGQNISLMSGTQMTMAVTASGSGASASGSASGSASAHR